MTALVEMSSFPAGHQEEKDSGAGDVSPPFTLSFTVSDMNLAPFFYQLLYSVVAGSSKSFAFLGPAPWHSVYI